MLDLRHFTPAEFRGWGELLSPRLLVVLDVFRGHWGAPVMISPAQGAIGRRLGPDATSQHNPDRWGEVRAVDVMPEGMDTAQAMRQAMYLARWSGATGIGVYPHWRPRPGLHIDVRTDRDVGDPALWGAVDEDGTQIYVSLARALEVMG